MRFPSKMNLADSIIYRSSRSQMFFKVSVIENLSYFTGTHLCWSLFLNTVSGLKASNFIKKGLQHRCFTEIFAKYSRTTFFLQSTSGGYLARAIHQTSFNLNPIIMVQATMAC